MKKGGLMIANRKESCSFDTFVNGEKWHIEMAWIQENGEIAWYEGGIHREGVKFTQIFEPSKIKEESWKAS